MTETETPTIETVAQTARDAFEAAERHQDEPGRDAETFYRVKDGAPDWITDAVRDAHDGGGILPDDWIYETAADAFEAIADGADQDDGASEFADSVDIYSSPLAEWLANSAYARSAVDEAAEEGLVEQDASIDRRIMAGQYVMRRRIFDAIYRACEEQADEED